MPKNQRSDSEAEEIPDSPGCDAGNQRVSDYERQRLSRIAENRKRLEALGLPKMVSSLMGGSRQSSAGNSKNDKGKKKVDKDEDEDEDEDYAPNSDDGVDDGEDVDDENDDDEDFSVSGSARKKAKSKASTAKKTPVKKLPVSLDQVGDNELTQGKKKGSKQKKTSTVKKLPVGSDYVGDDDELMQAIALSLQDSAASLESRDAGCLAQAENASQKVQDPLAQEDSRRRKRNKMSTNRVKMTEDELVLHFFQLDEVGKGSINIRDLERVAVAHDFMWTDKELADMIHFFDGDRDGKLNFEDFRRIVQRCHMLQGSEE